MLYRHRTSNIIRADVVNKVADKVQQVLVPKVSKLKLEHKLVWLNINLYNYMDWLFNERL